MGVSIFYGRNRATGELATMGTQKPSGTGYDFISVLLSPILIRALDRYILEEAKSKTRSDALRDAFKEWCVDRGYINPNDIDLDLS